MSPLPENSPAAAAEPAALVQRRPLRRWLARIGPVALPLVLAALLFYWHERQDTWGGRSGAQWSYLLATGNAAERQQAEAGLRALGSNAVPSLCRALLRPDSRFRALGQRVARSSPPALRQWFQQKFPASDPVTARLAAAQGLSLLGPIAEAAVPDLVAGLASRDPSVAWQASQTLGRIGPAAVPALITALEKSDPTVRVPAAYALAQIGRPAHAAVPALEAALTTTNQSVCQAVLQALNRIWTNPVAHYSNLLVTQRGTAREVAARAVRQFNFPPRLLQPPLLEVLRDDSAGARLAAVQGLGMLPGWSPETFAALCRARLDADPLVRSNATVVLADANLRARIPAQSLMELLADPSAEYRAEAARALGSLGTNALPAVPQLEALAAGPDEALRQAALESLQRLTNTLPR